MNQALFSRINLVLLAALIVVTLAGFVLVPAETRLPIHWGPSGQPDAFWPRNAALLVAPAMVVALSALFAVVGRLADAENVASAKHAWATVVPAMTGLVLAIQAAIVLIGLGYPDQMVRIITFAIAILLILMGNVLPKTQVNTLAGLRLPWIMKDHALWRATQRLTGILFVAGGVMLLLCALVRQPMWLFIALLAAVLVPVVAGGLYSYRLARRGGPNAPPNSAS